jgi:5-methylcytosine-specific restriction endonuclease McrA
MTFEPNPSPQIISRKEARLRGQPRYFTAKPCCRGHIAERYVDSAGCVPCSAGNTEAWRERRRNPPPEVKPVIVAVLYDGPIVSRAEAKRLGLLRYFMGPDMPCKNGHIAERQTVNGTCMRCATDRNIQRAHANPAETKAQAAASYQKHREKRRKTAAVYIAANRDKLRDSKAAYYQANRKSRRAKIEAWNKANPEKTAAYGRNKKARKRAAEGFHTGTDIAHLYTEQAGRCACCGRELNGRYEVDHIIALMNGGSNWPDNLQLLCQPCNNSKSDRDPVEFCRSYFRRNGVWPLFAITRGFITDGN